MAIKVCITGAPCSGKTETMKLLKDLRGFDFNVKVVPEAPTYLCSGPNALHYKPNNQNPVENKYFDLMVYFSRALSCEQVSNLSNCDFVLFDRGTLDGLYYNPDLLSDAGTTLEEELSRYDAVVLMENLAHTDNYSLDNNGIRTETAMEALKIEEHLISIYSQHHNFFKIYSRHNNLKRASILLKFLEGLK